MGTLLPPANRSSSPRSFLTCEYSSSTGVARPKIETETLTRPLPSSTSSTVPENELNGPSETRTSSPMRKEMVGFGCSVPSFIWLMMRSASLSVIGCGRPPPPRKPVTLAVLRTSDQVSSLSSIFTST